MRRTPLNLRPASRELEAWPDYRWEKAAELAPFLEELRLAEDSAGLRLEPRSTPHRYKDYRPALENQPRVVTEHPELLEHIGPVLEKERRCRHFRTERLNRHVNHQQSTGIPGERKQ